MMLKCNITKAIKQGIFIVLCGSFFVIPTSVAAHDWIQLAPVTPQSLNTFIKKTGLFSAAKTPTMKNTLLYSHGIKDGKHYSIYSMQPLTVIGKVTQYKTTEEVTEGWRIPGIPKGQGATIHGKGLSLGGLFWPKESMIVYGNNHKLIYDNRIDIIAIKPISGHLFPLKVGNELKFKFKRIHSRLFAGKTKVKNEIGMMTYKVINQYNNFSYSHKKIPTPIYEVEVWESTNSHPKPYLTDIYKYSNGFHWYISDKYYDKNNQLVAWYRVKNWY